MKGNTCDHVDVYNKTKDFVFYNTKTEEII